MSDVGRTGVLYTWYLVLGVLGVLGARTEVSGTQGHPSMENGEQREQEDKKTQEDRDRRREGGGQEVRRTLESRVGSLELGIKNLEVRRVCRYE